MTWLDQLASKSKRKTAKGKEQSPADQTEKTKDFQIVHFPDRPAREVLYSEVPTEEECREIFTGLINSGGNQGGDMPGHRKPKRHGENKGSTSGAWPTKPALQLRIPEHRDDDVTRHQDGIITGRRFSPRSITNAIKAAAADRKQPASTRIEPWRPSDRNSTPQRERYTEKILLGSAASRSAPPRTAPFRLSSIMNQPRSASMPQTQTTHQEQLRRKADALPVSPSRKPQNSPATALCNLCRSGLALPRGLCRDCEEDFTAPKSASTMRSASTPTKAALRWRPLPPIPQELDHVALHYDPNTSTPSLSTTNTDTVSPMSSPRSAQVAFAVQPPRIGTPTRLSALDTPSILSRFYIGEPVESKGKDKKVDLYEEDWAEYYFDQENFKGRKGSTPETPSRYLNRGLSLGDYDAAFTKPHELAAQEWL